MPVQARDVLGVFNRWGAFRDAREARCYAISEPIDWRDPRRDWSPFAAIGFWPRQGVRGQLSIKLSRALQKDAAATLAIGGKRFKLSGNGADVWAKDRQDDAAIVGAPVDELVSDRPGTRYGPRAIRAASCPPGPHLETKIDWAEVLRVVDYGDAPIRPAM